MLLILRVWNRSSPVNKVRLWSFVALRTLHCVRLGTNSNVTSRLIYTGFLIAPAVSNLLPKYLPALQAFGAFFNISNALLWAIIFLVKADKNSSKFVFSQYLNSSGWGPRGWVFILSMYVPIYGLVRTHSHP
jgi:hypothetical protein